MIILPLKERIRKHYKTGITYTHLMLLVFPPDQYPRAWRNSSNGGPPGCAMAFGRALRQMGGRRDYSRDLYNVIFLPTDKEKQKQ